MGSNVTDKSVIRVGRAIKIVNNTMQYLADMKKVLKAKLKYFRVFLEDLM